MLQALINEFFKQRMYHKNKMVASAIFCDIVIRLVEK